MIYFFETQGEAETWGQIYKTVERELADYDIGDGILFQDCCSLVEFGKDKVFFIGPVANEPNTQPK